MSEKKAKLARAERKAMGIPEPTPRHNFTDRPDTRHDRRLKRCRPKLYAKQLGASSFLDRMMHWAKWRAAFSAVPAVQEAAGAQPMSEVVED